MRRCLLALAGVLGVLGSCGSPGEAPEGAGRARGERVYRMACATCHGLRGDGNGVTAGNFTTRPRDFTRGIFKFRSTPTGTQPTEQDLVRTITEGLHGTSMPPFAAMDRGDVMAVASYVRELYRRSLAEDLRARVEAGELDPETADAVLEQRSAPGEPIAIPDEPPMDQASVERGRAVYARMECAKCHGLTGKGDGPSADELVDEWGRKIVPADFTTPAGIKRGKTPRDIYTIFMTGINGTPMPSYSGKMSPREAWDLAHYVMWLRRKGR